MITVKVYRNKGLVHTSDGYEDIHSAIKALEQGKVIETDDVVYFRAPLRRLVQHAYYKVQASGKLRFQSETFAPKEERK